MKTIVSVLKDGGVGIIPTDTLYGVVGQALSKKAVERIYEAKGRDHSKPLIILISKIADLEHFAVPKSIIKKHTTFLSGVWPGPVSVILPCKIKKLEYLHRGTKSLAFRMPNDKYLLALLAKTGPLVAPSANPQGMPPAETIAEAKKYFKNTVDFYVPGGRKKGKPSTIISLVTESPVVLRK